MNKPLMPKATAVWLVDNTKLTFDQIADFCGLHPLEVKGIADGDVAQGIKGLDPVAAGQLSREEIERAEKDQGLRLRMAMAKHSAPESKATSRRGPRYTPVSRRQDRPNAIAWLVRHHPELTDAQISKLVGTTKSTISSIRERNHWNMANIKPADPVTLGLCTQIELDFAVQKAALRVSKSGAVLPQGETHTLRPANETVVDHGQAEREAEEAERALDRKARLDPEAFFKPRPNQDDNNS